jgi:hypothetical protein
MDIRRSMGALLVEIWYGDLSGLLRAADALTGRRRRFLRSIRQQFGALVAVAVFGMRPRMAGE